jgi:tetratricopeptide (TPR) repeat protein
VIRPVARFLSLALLLAATAVPSAGEPAATPVVGAAPSAPGRAPGPAPEAVEHYLTARLLEEREMDAEALEEYLRALELDPGRAAIERRVSAACSRLGDARRALEYAALALEHEPGDAQAHWLMGSALFNLGRPADALAALRAAVVAEPGQAAYWRTLARVAETLGRVDQAAEGWRHAVELDDADGEGWFQLAAAEARLGHFEAADSLLLEARALNPVRPGLLFLEGLVREGQGNPGEAVALYRQHLRAYPEDQATRRRLVNLLARAGHHAEAYREATVVRQAEPGDPEAIGVEADLAMYVGQNARADELLDRLLAADPEDPTRVMQAAGILSGHGRVREALARSAAWAAEHPLDYRGALLLARGLSDAGDTTGAVVAARRAVAMAPDSLAPRFVLGGLLQAARRFAAAESVWVELTRLRPGATRAGMELAYCRQSQGDVEGAVSALRDVIAREPDNASALNYLGYLFADRNRDLEEAEGLVRRALARDPDNGAYVDSMGWVYYRMGRLEEARRELERAVALTRGDPVVLEHLGDVYKSLNLIELAREQYRRSLSRSEGNERVKAKLSELR